MKKLIILIVLFFIYSKGYTQPENFLNCKHSDFLIEAYEMAWVVHYKYNIPMGLTIAVAILESGYGTSYAAKVRFNYFGMVKGKRVYKNITESFLDFGWLLNTKDRYKSLKKLDPKNLNLWCEGLVKCGYNNHLDYAGKLIAIIKQYKLNEI